MKIAVLWWGNINDAPNSALNQRLSYLADRHEVALYVTPTARVSGPLTRKVEVRRVPEAPCLLRGEVASTTVQVCLSAAEFIRTVVWTLRALASEPGLRQGVVYSFHTPEAAVARLAQCFGYRWVADILDMPDLYLEVVESQRALGRRAILRPLKYRYVYRLPRIFAHADLVLTTAHGPGRGFAQRLVQEFGVRPERLHTVSNGVDLSLVHPTGRKPPIDVFRATYVGMVAPSRGVDVLLEATRVASQRIERLELCLVGDTYKPYEATVTRAVEKLERAAGRPVISLHGFLPHDRLRALVEESHVCLYPFPKTPILDGVHPIKVFEYLALGRPVVATDLDGVREIVQHEVNGLVVPPSNSLALADALVRLYQRPDDLGRFAAAARPSVLRYDWRLINERVEHTVREFAQDGGPMGTGR